MFNLFSAESKTIITEEMVKNNVKNFDFIYGLTKNLVSDDEEEKRMNIIIDELQKTEFYNYDKVFAENKSKLQKISHKIHSLILKDRTGVRILIFIQKIISLVIYKLTKY